MIVLEGTDLIPLNKVDWSNPRDVVGTIAYYWEAARQHAIDYADIMFTIGCLIHKNKTKIGMKTMADILNTREAMLKEAHEVAIKCNFNLSEFRKRMTDNSINNWRSYCDQMLGNPHQGKRKMNTSVTKVINTELSNIKEGKPTQTDLHELKMIRDKLTRLLPQGAETFDHTFIKYYDCCGCGEEPGKDGFPLSEYKGIEHMRYPLCEECREKGIEPDLERIALMYASYAYNTDQAYYNINEI